jgi:predicted regulator of Ras-like GTPase activity (Roadblock/LC7/MglB family)
MRWQTCDGQTRYPGGTGGAKLTKNANANHTETALTDIVVVTTADNEDPAFASLGASLAEIRKMDGVLGYIIRSNVSAVLDLAKNDEISQYALFSYQLDQSSMEIAKQLSVAEIESALVEGSSLKVLLMKIGENKISVFMEKNANHSAIIKRILI